MHAWGSLMPYHYDDGSEFSYHNYVDGQLHINNCFVHSKPQWSVWSIRATVVRYFSKSMTPE